MDRTVFPALVACAWLASPTAFAAAPAAAPPASAGAERSAADYQQLIEAAAASVNVKVKALANARSNATLGQERTGSGTYIAPHNLVLTIGYLVIEAESVEVSTASGRTIPATVAAYDPATGFGLLRPLAPLDVKPIALGSSARVEALDKLLVAGGAGDDTVSIATVVSRRPFAGYWEYFLDDAIFTTPPRPDFGGAALINREGRLVGVGSLFVMDAAEPGQRMPGNMFVPIDLLKPILDDMVAKGRNPGAARPWLGVSSMEQDGRLHVIRVSSDSPAERAGLEPGDIILQLGGAPVRRLEDFYKRLWASGAPGVEVKLRVLKGTDVQDLTIRTIDRAENMRKRPSI